MFTKLRSAEHFVDATLWCEGKTIKCHKMILSACSTYFEKLLTENPNPHPIIFLKDMRFWEISALVEFMYRGEVSIHQEKLQNLLRAAESLQIKGLGSPSANDGGGGSAADLGAPQSTSQAPGGDASSLLDLDDDRSVDMSTTPSNSTLHYNNSSSERGGGGSLNLSQHSLLNSMNMGMDLSNHHASTPLGFNNNNSLISNNNSLIHSSSVPSVKRRKKETPRRIDIPRAAALPLPLFNAAMAVQQQQQHLALQQREAAEKGEDAEMPMMESEDPGNCSDDSMAAHERNQVDVVSDIIIHHWLLPLRGSPMKRLQ